MLQLFKTLDAQRDCIFIHLMHKRYALLAKLLDLVFEPYLLLYDIDFYRDGHNVAMTNMLYYCADMVDRTRFDSMLWNL